VVDDDGGGSDGGGITGLVWGGPASAGRRATGGRGPGRPGVEQQRLCYGVGMKFHLYHLVLEAGAEEGLGYGYIFFKFIGPHYTFISIRR
jgi:hypothetical protein